MKKVIVIILLLYSNFTFGQNRSIDIKFYIDDSIQYIESNLKFTFKTSTDSCEVKVKDGKIKLPDLCFQSKYINMIVSFQNEIAIVSNILVKQSLV